jgi:hypothetical protein
VPGCKITDRNNPARRSLLTIELRMLTLGVVVGIVQIVSLLQKRSCATSPPMRSGGHTLSPDVS